MSHSAEWMESVYGNKGPKLRSRVLGADGSATTFEFQSVQDSDLRFGAVVLRLAPYSN